MVFRHGVGVRRRVPGVGLIAAGLVLSATGAFGADFNGDGVDDVAIGVPDETIGGPQVRGGAVLVIYGLAGAGLSVNAPAIPQLWHQNVGGIPDAVQQGDLFGLSVATGDFNNDGFDDLAIGVPGEDFGNVQDAGAVCVIYGSPVGLAVPFGGGVLAAQHFTQAGLPEVAEAGDQFGWSVEAGDFDGDGFDDLAVGVPFEGVQTPQGNQANAGCVNIIFGSPAGLQVGGPGLPPQTWVQSSPGVPEVSEAGDEFGVALAAGDFNADGVDDLSIGAATEDVGPNNNIVDGGAVIVLAGTPGAGLSPFGPFPAQYFDQDSPGVPDRAEFADNFGRALSAGDFDGDGASDLAIGVWKEDFNVADVGLVNVIYGQPGLGLNPLGPIGAQAWHQNSAGIPDSNEVSDFWGFSLSVGDFDASGTDDLVVGAPYEDVKPVGIVDGGQVTVIYSQQGVGLSVAGTPAQVWHQDKPGVPERVDGRMNPWAGDQLGYGVASGDFDGNGSSDLVCGVIYEDVGNAPIRDAGGLSVIYGFAGAPGLNPAGPTPAQYWSQNTPGIPERSETGDLMGFSVRSR